PACVRSRPGRSPAAGQPRRARAPFDAPVRRRGRGRDPGVMSTGSSFADLVPPAPPRAVDYLALTKARLPLLAALSAVAGLWLASPGPIDPARSLCVFAGAALASA